MRKELLTLFLLIVVCNAKNLQLTLLGSDNTDDNNLVFLQAYASESCESSNQCLNEGVCVKSKCYCKNLFVGPICQYELSQPIEVNNIIFFIMCLLAVVLGILFILALNLFIRKRQEEKVRREGEYSGTKYEIWTATNA